MSKIINFEGLPGVGKTTALSFVKSKLTDVGIRCVSTSDLLYYKGDRVGEKIYDIMRYGNDAFMRLDYPYIEAFLSQAIRFNIVFETLEKGKEFDVILEDRGLDTYFSYMLARISKEQKKSYEEIICWLEKLNKFCEVQYTCSILLKDELNECRKRYERKNEKQLSKDDWTFLFDVSKAYDFLAKKYKRISVINVTGKDELQVGNEIFESIIPLVGGIKHGM